MILTVTKVKKGYLISIKGGDETLVKDRDKAIQLIKFMAGNLVRQADNDRAVLMSTGIDREKVRRGEHDI